jgi:hypothetical protein
MIPVTVGENTYKSVSEAWREESPKGLPMITVRWRLKNGWATYIAFKMPRIPAVDRRLYKVIREMEWMEAADI